MDFPYYPIYECSFICGMTQYSVDASHRFPTGGAEGLAVNLSLLMKPICSSENDYHIYEL